MNRSDDRVRDRSEQAREHQVDAVSRHHVGHRLLERVEPVLQAAREVFEVAGPQSGIVDFLPTNVELACGRALRLAFLLDHVGGRVPEQARGHGE